MKLVMSVTQKERLVALVDKMYELINAKGLDEEIREKLTQHLTLFQNLVFSDFEIKDVVDYERYLDCEFEFCDTPKVILFHILRRFNDIMQEGFKTGRIRHLSICCDLGEKVFLDIKQIIKDSLEEYNGGLQGGGISHKKTVVKYEVDEQPHADDAVVKDIWTMVMKEDASKLIGSFISKMDEKNKALYTFLFELYGRDRETFDLYEFWNCGVLQRENIIRIVNVIRTVKENKIKVVNDMGTENKTTNMVEVYALVVKHLDKNSEDNLSFRKCFVNEKDYISTSYHIPINSDEPFKTSDLYRKDGELYGNFFILFMKKVEDFDDMSFFHMCRNYNKTVYDRLGSNSANKLHKIKQLFSDFMMI